MSFCTGDVGPDSGRRQILSIWRCDRFLKDDVEPCVARKRNDHVLGICHRHQFLLTCQSDVRCDALPQQNTLIDRACQPAETTATYQGSRHRPNASHRANQRALRAISSIHDSLQRTVVQTDAAAFDTLGTAIWHFESSKAKTNLAILVGLRQLPDCLRACRDDDLAVPLVVVLNHRDGRRLHRATDGSL